MLIKELLFTIIRERMILQLVSLLITYWISWWIGIALGLRMLDVKGKSGIILPGALVAALCSLFLKPLLPVGFGVFFSIVPLIIALRLYGRARLLVCCWITLFLLLIIIIGSSLIDNSLCALNENIVHFLFKTPFGLSIIALLENVCPAIVLLCFSIFNISLMASLESLLATVNFLDVYLFGAMFYWFYSASMRLFVILVNYTGQFNPHLYVEWFISGGAVIGICIRQIDFKNIKKNIKGLQEKIQELTETNQELNERVTLAQNDEPDTVPGSPQGIEDLPIVKKRTYKIPDKNGIPDKVKIGASHMSVLLLIGLGKSNKEIVDITGLADGTVRNIVTELLRKLKCDDRTQLAIYVTTHKILNMVNKE